MIEPIAPERLTCAVPVCPSIARRWFNGAKYCEPCFSSVYQDAYVLQLPTDARERALSRRTLATDPPKGSARRNADDRAAS